jgi:membrane carboxypeptidase/penicillin-binding protein
MQEDGVLSTEEKDHALAAPPKLVAFEQKRRDSGLHFIDFLSREAKTDGIPSLTAEPFTVHSTINGTLQREAEAALQEGLARYEIDAGRVKFRGPEANISDTIQKLMLGRQSDAPDALPAWQQALQAVKLPLSDVHWEPAVILDKGGFKRGDGNIRVGIRDGRVLPLNAANANSDAKRNLGLYDVVYVRVIEGKTVAKLKNGGAPAAVGTVGGRAELRVRPTVQGAALVLENKTGRILAMAGSFSYFSSQLNRTSQTQRQPGSAMKPLTYLTGLQAGLQPNTLVSDDPITLAPIGWHHKHGTIARGPDSASRQEDFWTPRNADGSTGGMLTMRRGLENSINLVTAHLLADGINDDPEKSLAQVCATALAAKIYKECIRYYPFVLGAQPVRMIDLAAFYAAVANEGALPKAHAIDSIEVDGKMVFQYPNAPLPFIGAADRTSFFQLKTMLQGVVARGTARAIADLSPFVAGKTGTTEDAVDGWFIGFTNDVTVAVWVGYDNSDGKRRSLGTRASGAGVALPIFEPILQAIWALEIAPKASLNGPSPDAKRYLVDLPIDYNDGSRRSRGSREGFIEHFRIGADGKIKETQYQLASREGPSRPRKARSDQNKLASREAPSRPRKAGPGIPWGESAWKLGPAKPTERGGFGAWGWDGSASQWY